MTRRHVHDVNSASAAPDWFRADVLAKRPDAWSTYIDAWLHIGDPLADEFLVELRKRGRNLRDPAAELVAIASEARPPAVATALLSELRELPHWVDFDLMRRGAHMAQRDFMPLTAALTYGALPLVFSHPSSAAVFMHTGHFAASISRRLNESATLFFGVTHSDQLRPGQRMWAACVHVRMIHAVIRKHLLESPRWDVVAHGLPINAYQTSAGPAFFGARVLRGMRALGAAISDEEAAGHNMTWRYVSYLLGVPKPLLAATQSDQDVFDDALLRHAFMPDDTGRKMIAVLLDGLVASPPTQRIPRGLQIALLRSMLGEAWADAFTVPHGDARALRALQSSLSAYSRIGRTRVAEAGARRLGQRVLDDLAKNGLLISDLDRSRAH